MSRCKLAVITLLLSFVGVQRIWGQTPNKNVKEIIVVFKTHFDIGYTHRVKDVVRYYRTDMIDHALAIMDSSKSLPADEQFKWTCPGWVMSKVMEPWPGQTAERRQKLDEAFTEGRFITHALPFTIETDVCEPEVLTRGLDFASRLTRQYHLPLPLSAKVTDMPSHSGELATVLGNAGVKFLHIGCNWPSGFVQTPGLFWWEGPDGSRVLTFYSSIYGTTTGLGWPDDWGGGERFVGRGLLPPADWPYKVWPAIFVTLDNSGPPDAKKVKALFDEARKKLPGVKIRVGTMGDFAREILATHPQLPIVKKEMPDTWIHGFMSDPGGSRLSRESAPLLAADEILNTQLKVWGLPVQPIADSMAKAYEMMDLYAEHTWGGGADINQYGDAFKKLDPSSYADLEASWEDKTDYVRNAWHIAGHVQRDNLTWLAHSVACGPDSVIVYNPLPWRRNGIADIKGQTVLVKNIPACGYTTVAVPDRPLAKASANNFIENRFYKVTFDAASGTIQSLVDKSTGYEWAANVSGVQTGQYCNERFTLEQTEQYTEAYQQHRAWDVFGTKGDWLHPGMYKPGMISGNVVPYRMASPSGGKLSIVVTGREQTAMLEMPADTARHLPATRLKITLIDDQPYLDIEITIIGKAKDNWPEADWLALPFHIKNPAFKVYRSLGIMDPTDDILKGANKYLYTAGQGVTLADADGNGIAVCPLDHPLISLDTPGCWKFSLDFIPKKPIVYINLYNNQWNTNYRYWYPGTWSSRIRIWTFDSKTPQGEILAVPSLEARYPLQVTAPENSTGKLPEKRKGVELSRKGVLVTAFGEDPDGNNGILLRLWEMTGVSGEVGVVLPGDRHFTRATPINLRGEVAGKGIPIVNGEFSCPIKGFGPASFILDAQPPMIECKAQQTDAKQVMGNYRNVFTQPPVQTPSDVSVDGPLLGNGFAAAAMAGPPDSQTYFLARNDFWRLKSAYNESFPAVLGKLQILVPALKGASYRVEQKLYEAVTVADFKKGDAALRITSLVAATKDWLIITLTNTGTERLNVQAILRLPGEDQFHIDPPTVNKFADTVAMGHKAGLQWIERGFVREVDIPTMAAAAMKSPGEFSIPPGTTDTLICVLSSNFKAKDCLTQVLRDLQNMHPETIHEILREHADWWRRYWNESFISIGDSLIEALYYTSQYNMASCSRDPKFPPGIFGSWVTREIPAWNGDYHLNYNYSAPFYALYSSNHLQQARPYEAPLTDFLPRGKVYSKEIAGIDGGALYPVGIGPLGIETTREDTILDKHDTGYVSGGQVEDRGLFFGQKSDAAYGVTDLSMQFYRTYDVGFTRRVYPFVRSVAVFWQHYLLKEGDRYVIVNDAIHEGTIGTKNPILSLGLVPMVLKTAIDMSVLLGVDENLRGEWQGKMDSLPAYPVQQRHGKTVFRYTDSGVDWWNGNTLGIQHIYPAGGIGLSSDPALLDIARNTIDEMQRWMDVNGSNSFFPAAVRVGYNADTVLQRLRAYCRHTRPNGFQLRNPHGIENCSTVPNTVDEMLCMSNQHVLRVFADWPGSRDASFSTLRSEGAFLVSSVLKSGTVQYVKIVSEKGRTCVLQNPWPGRAVVVRSNKKTMESKSGEVISLRTLPGEVLLITESK